jgi:hypothetical protein
LGPYYDPYILPSANPLRQRFHSSYIKGFHHFPMRRKIDSKAGKIDPRKIIVRKYLPKLCIICYYLRNQNNEGRIWQKND